MRGASIQLLLDEPIWVGLREALAQRGYDVIHLNDTGQRGIDDEPLLAFATAQDRAVLTYNTRHFVPLVSLWYEAGREPAGGILSVQLSRGELLRQIERLLATLSAAALNNTVRWLQEFRSEG
jgi:predicted nuclease of predicted toxin-antitoxin system